MKKLFILLASTLLLASCGGAPEVSSSETTSSENTSSEDTSVDTRKVNEAWASNYAEIFYGAASKTASLLDNVSFKAGAYDVSANLSIEKQESVFNVEEDWVSSPKKLTNSVQVSLDELSIEAGVKGLLTARKYDDLKAYAKETLKGSYAYVDHLLKPSETELEQDSGVEPDSGAQPETDYAAAANIDFTAFEELLNGNIYTTVSNDSIVSLGSGASSLLLLLGNNNPMLAFIGTFLNGIVEDVESFFPTEGFLLGNIHELFNAPEDFPGVPVSSLPSYEMSGIGAKIHEFFDTGFGANEALDLGEFFDFNEQKEEGYTTYEIGFNLEHFNKVSVLFGLSQELYSSMLLGLDLGLKFTINDDGALKGTECSISASVNGLPVDTDSEYEYDDETGSLVRAQSTVTYLTGQIAAKFATEFDFESDVDAKLSDPALLETYEHNQFVDNLIPTLMDMIAPSQEPVIEEPTSEDYSLEEETSEELSEDLSIQ